jgi:hypothetical protein
MTQRWLAVLLLLLLGLGCGRMALAADCSSFPGNCDPSAAIHTDTRTGVSTIDACYCPYETPTNANYQQMIDNVGVFGSPIVLNNPSASDDGIPFPIITFTSAEVVKVGCRVSGTCATPPTFTIKDSNGDTISTTSTPTCATGSGAVTFVDVDSGDADRLLAAGQTPFYDTTNTPSCAWFVVEIKVKAALE